MIRDTDPYVPFSNMHHTHLRETPDMNKEPKQVIYDTEYAQRVYKGTSMNFDKSSIQKQLPNGLKNQRKQTSRNGLKV